MNGVFERSYDAVTTLALSKPFVIAEVAYTEKGGDKASCAFPDRIRRHSAHE